MLDQQPDRRFTHNPSESRHRAAYKGGSGPRSLPAVSSHETTAEEATARDISYWPPPLPRASGLPRELIDTVQSTSPRRFVENITATPVDLLDISSDNIMAKNMASLRHHTPDCQATPLKVVSPAKSGLSDWVKTLEKTLKNDAETADIHTRAGYGSIPPHLRRHLGKGSGVVDKKHSGLNPTAASFNCATQNSGNFGKKEARLKDQTSTWQVAADDDVTKRVRAKVFAPPRILRHPYRPVSPGASTLLGGTLNALASTALRTSIE